MLNSVGSHKGQAQKKVLAVCSGGGHWAQLKRLIPAFHDSHLTLATVLPADLSGIEHKKVIGIPDANRDTKLKMLLLLVRLAWIVFRVRPDCIVSTGAAAGYWAVRLGKLLGAKTVFIDSIANAEELSMSARLVRRHADVTLSQWEDVR